MKKSSEVDYVTDKVQNRTKSLLRGVSLWSNLTLVFDRANIFDLLDENLTHNALKNLAPHLLIAHYSLLLEPSLMLRQNSENSDPRDVSPNKATGLPTYLPLSNKNQAGLTSRRIDRR